MEDVKEKGEREKWKEGNLYTSVTLGEKQPPSTSPTTEDLKTGGGDKVQGVEEAKDTKPPEGILDQEKREWVKLKVGEKKKTSREN